MERCVHKHLYNFIISNSLHISFQSEFIKGDSTTNQLIYIYNDICSSLNQGKEVRAVSCDISKAFDRVWHKGLLHKLLSLGTQGQLLCWFASYLSSRKQPVVVANTSSSWSSLSAGVPQESILVPPLFLIFINDIVNSIHSKVRLFADDTSLYIIVDNRTTAAMQPNSDLEKNDSLSNTWLDSFDPEKTEFDLF